MPRFITHDIVEFKGHPAIFSHYTSGDFCVIDSISEDGTSKRIELEARRLKKMGRVPCQNRGKLTTIVGPMSSGKTLELIRKLVINKVQGKEILVAKHNIDTRDIKDPGGVNHIKVQSRIGIEYDAISFPSSDALLNYLFVHGLKKIDEGKNPKFDVIGIEEGQFWDDGLIRSVKTFTSNCVDVYITGLNQNFRGEGFGIMPELMALSDEIVLLKGVCSICKQEATKTQRLIDDEPAPKSSPDILVGAEEGNERYECRCVNCWSKPI
jgi:thymidine kinase